MTTPTTSAQEGADTAAGGCPAGDADRVMLEFAPRRTAGPARCATCSTSKNAAPGLIGIPERQACRSSRPPPDGQGSGRSPAAAEPARRDQCAG